MWQVRQPTKARESTVGSKGKAPVGDPGDEVPKKLKLFVVLVLV